MLTLNLDSSKMPVLIVVQKNTPYILVRVRTGDVDEQHPDCIVVRRKLKTQPT
jgi:hypothetical protein